MDQHSEMIAALRGDDGEPAPFRLYITYGYGTNLRDCFSVVEGEDYADCRQKAYDGTREGMFAFAYTEAEFAGQRERYNLREVPLQPMVYLEK